MYPETYTGWQLSPTCASGKNPFLLSYKGVLEDFLSNTSISCGEFVYF